MFRKLVKFMVMLAILILAASSSFAIDDLLSVTQLDREAGFHSYFFAVRGASSTVQTSPIPVMDKSTATVQIFEATGIGPLQGTTARGNIGSCTRSFWIEGKVGTDSSASAYVAFATLPTFYKDTQTTLIAGATAGDVHYATGAVSKYGIYKFNVEGLSYIRVCMSGAVASVSQAIVVGTK